MQITHNEITAGLWLVVAVSSGAAGFLFSRWRPSAKVLQEEYEAGHDDGWDARGDWERDRAEPEEHSFYDRRTVLLEAGPTIYPALAALAGEALDGPEKPVAASDSTWLYKILLDWENRYPIPLDSPNERMAEAI